MAWPVSQDYNEAIQSPASNFADPDLRTGLATINALGLPMPFSGNFADVYQVRDSKGGRWAVKCFTRQAPGLRERYLEISKHLRQAKLPFTVDFTYLEQGIRIAGKWYPVLKMQWVEGLTFNEFVRQHLDKPAMLEGLLQIWARMAKYLRAAGAAHCDLQHGNVLLVPGAGANSLAIKLIDYDGMYVPALAGTKSGEVGHPSYQHPQRLRDGTYSLEVDRFPLLLIATALRAVRTAGRPLWEKYDNGDNLLFRESDLRDPAQSEVFEELSQLDDPGTVALTAALRKSLERGLDSAPLLEDVLTDARPIPGPARAARPTATPPSIPTAASVAAAPPAPPPDDFDDFSTEESERPKSQRKRRKKEKAGIPVKVWVGASAAVAGLALVLCGGGAGAVYWATRNSPDKLAQASTPSPTPPDTGVPIGPGVTPTTPAVAPPRTNPAKPPDKDGSTDKPDNPPVNPDMPPGKVEKVALHLLHELRSSTSFLAFSSKTHRVAAHGVTDGTKLWALEEGGFKTLATLQPPSKEPVHALEFSPNGGELLIARTTSIHLWDVGTKQPLKTIVTGHKVAAIESVSFSPDGKRVVTTAWDTTARVSNLETGKEVCKFEGHGAMITGATFLPDGMQVVSAGVDGTLRVWDADNAKELGKLDGKPKVPMRLPVLSADGKRVVAAADDGTVYVWDVAARRESHRFIVKNPLVGRRKLALSPDGTLLAVLSSDWQKAELLLLDLKTGQERGRFVGKEYSTYALSFVDAHTIIGTGADGAIRLWRIEDLDTRPGDTVDSKPPVTEGPKPTDPPRKPLPALLRHHGPKAAVPDDAALAAAEKALKKEHEAEYARKQPEEVRALGEKVLLQGLDPKATLPSRYVALREARDLAASVGDLLVGLRAAEEMENRFNVRLAETKAPVLEKAGAAATSPAVRTSIAFYAASLTDDAVEDNDYATADRLVKIAQANLEKGAVGPVVDAIQARATEVAELRKAYEGVADAIRTVAAKPNDPDANLKLGKFYALQKGDWERGLPHLKRGSDAKLKALAETDWTMGRDTKPMEALADSYAEHGQTETGTAKTNLLLRACYWYGRSQLGRSGEEQNEILRKSHALESTVPLPRPVILCAWYGAFATWANVTDVIRFRMLQSPPQTKEFKIPPQELGGDLSPGDEKTLFVVYRYRGWVHLDTKPLISETPGGKPDKFIFSPVPTSALSDSFRPAPGQELHILHASLIKGGQAQFFGNKAQAQVKGATLKAKAADVGFNAGVRNEHQAYVIVYHDGTRVQLFMAPCSQDINIAAATSDTKPPGTESPIVTDTPRKPLPPLVKHSGPRVAVPDEAAVTAAESKVKKDHEAEYASEKPAEIRALAEKLLQQGLAQPAPAVRYVMLRDARDLAAANGDLPVAMRAADEVANQFRAKVAEVKAVALEKAAKANLAPDAQEALALAALGAADDAEEDDDYATAERLVKIAQNAVAAQGGGPLAQGVEVRAKEVAEVRKAYEKVTDAVRTLATKPKDPDANLAVGRFYALEKGDWDRGWPYLGRGSDAKLKDLVHSELTIKRDYKARLALADRFSAQAEGESGAAKTHLLLRVACWQMIARSAYFEKDIPDWVDKAYKLEQSLPPSRAVILEARYGAGKSWVDVTDTVRQATVKQPKPRSVTLFHPEDFGSDPAPAEEKTLVVLYRYRGSSHLAIKFARPEKPDSETKVFMFNPLWENTYPYLDLNPPSLGQEIIILDGELCGGGQSAYMGHTAQTLVKGAVLKAKAGDLCAMGSPERFKAVVLAYHDGHRVRLSVTLASDPLLIDAQAGKP